MPFEPNRDPLQPVREHAAQLVSLIDQNSDDYLIADREAWRGTPFAVELAKQLGHWLTTCLDRPYIASILAGSPSERAKTTKGKVIESSDLACIKAVGHELGVEDWSDLLLSRQQLLSNGQNGPMVIQPPWALLQGGWARLRLIRSALLRFSKSVPDKSRGGKRLGAGRKRTPDDRKALLREMILDKDVNGRSIKDLIAAYKDRLPEAWRTSDNLSKALRRERGRAPEQARPGRR